MVDMCTSVVRKPRIVRLAMYCISKRLRKRVIRYESKLRSKVAVYDLVLESIRTNYHQKTNELAMARALNCHLEQTNKILQKQISADQLKLE